MTSENPSFLKFWAPRYWFVWLVYGWMHASVLLPLSWQLAAGRLLGRCLSVALYPKRRIADRNLEVCFPELSKGERKRLRIRHFESIGMAVAEMAMGWFGSEAVIRDHVTINGSEHLLKALEKGRGVILFSAHFTTYEFGFPAFKLLCPDICGMYRDQRNEMWNLIMQQGRGRSISELFPKNSVRAMVRALNRNAAVWYAPDQSYRRKYSALVPFFDEPAMTNTATSRIAAATGAAVLTYFCRRLPGGTQYVIDIGPAPEGVPTNDLVADTTRLMKGLEDYIRGCPDQYCWIHQRFKDRPPPLPDIYRSGT
jgi:KDO2-lipid IV(A) lauroyltransferase